MPGSGGSGVSGRAGGSWGTYTILGGGGGSNTEHRTIYMVEVWHPPPRHGHGSLLWGRWWVSLGPRLRGSASGHPPPSGKWEVGGRPLGGGGWPLADRNHNNIYIYIYICFQKSEALTDGLTTKEGPSIWRDIHYLHWILKTHMFLPTTKH